MNGSGNSLAVRDRNAPAQPSAAALAIRDGQTTWDEFQNAALNQLGLEGASNADRAVFLHQCQRTGLDPFAKQIMMIGRQEKVPGSQNQWRTKWTIQTGIEGWRTIRDRAERREGVRGKLSRFSYYDDEDNERKVWTRPEPPICVEVTYTVRDRNGIETPYVSVLRYDEYVQTRKVTQNGVETSVPVAQWATKPVHMTEKCTEADVYRKTFPQDYAGIELTDAMPPPDPDAPPVQPERQRVTAADARARAPQAVTATVVTPEPSPAGTDTPRSAPPATPADVPPAGEAKTAAEYLADKLAQLGVSTGGMARVCARVLDRTVRPVDELPAVDVTAVMQFLRNCKTPEDLDGLLAELAMQGDPRGEDGEPGGE